jgi:hypothetical protein
MEDREEFESGQLLAQHPLRHQKFVVKLDKGFDEGTYAIYIEFDDHAEAKGVRAASKAANDYALLLQQQLAKFDGFAVGDIEDASRSAARGRRRDLDSTFLSFPVEYADGRWHDHDIEERFRLALARANQASEHAQARAQSQRRHTRQAKFRQQLDAVLSGDAYRHVDPATKERLAGDITRLVFPERSIDLE